MRHGVATEMTHLGPKDALSGWLADSWQVHVAGYELLLFDTEKMNIDIAELRRDKTNRRYLSQWGKNE